MHLKQNKNQILQIKYGMCFPSHYASDEINHLPFLGHHPSIFSSPLVNLLQSTEQKFPLKENNLL